MSELLFECYNVPSICYGVDSLFSYHHYDQHQVAVPVQDALIVSLGYQCCHVIPVLDNKAVFENTRRLNTGTLIFLMNFILKFNENWF